MKTKGKNKIMDKTKEKKSKTINTHDVKIESIAPIDADLEALDWYKCADGLLQLFGYGLNERLIDWLYFCDKLGVEPHSLTSINEEPIYIYLRIANSVLILNIGFVYVNGVRLKRFAVIPSYFKEG